MTRFRLLGQGHGVTTALVAALVTVLVVCTSPAATADSVGAAKRYTVTGHGWGHGHGLSQYGALGAAKKGVGWKKILRFYYPGTRLARAHGRIRVLITADTTKDVMVDARTGLRLRRLSDHKTFRLDRIRPKATRWKIVPKGAKSVVSFKRSGRPGWTRWTAFRGAAELTAGNRALTLRLPGRATAQYRGALRSVGKDTVNVLPLDRYVQGVVPREVPPEWPANAVRAQAVAARTYAAFERAHSTSHYDLCDTTSCQVYGGVAAEHRAATAAVRRTKGRVVTYQGAPAFTQFSSSNGGWTSAGSQPYLVARKDPYEAASGNPYANWTATITKGAIQRAWPAIGSLTGMEFTRDGHGDFGGRVTRVRLTGSAGAVTVSGEDFRYLLGLRSTYFKVAAGR